MKGKFVLSCGSTVDLPYEYVHGRDIEVIFYSYLVDEIEYTDDMGRDPSALPNFYKMLDEGKLPSTSQVNTYSYVEHFERLIAQGDVLHIAFGSGMSASVNNAFEAAEIVREKHPERRITVIDSLCSSSGYGMLVDCAADMRDEGKSMEETEKWLMENRRSVHHQFFSTDLKFFRRSGRVSGPAAAIGSVLNICPLMRLNAEGRIIAYSKVRGKANAIKTTVDTVEQHAVGGRNYSGKCWVCHSNCIETAEKVKAALMERFPNIQGDVRICDIGTIIASHAGPGTVAVFFFGDERPE